MFFIVEDYCATIMANVSVEGVGVYLGGQDRPVTVLWITECVCLLIKKRLMIKNLNLYICFLNKIKHMWTIWYQLIIWNPTISRFALTMVFVIVGNVFVIMGILAGQLFSIYSIQFFKLDLKKYCLRSFVWRYCEHSPLDSASVAYEQVRNIIFFIKISTGVQNFWVMPIFNCW